MFKIELPYIRKLSQLIYPFFIHNIHIYIYIFIKNEVKDVDNFIYKSNIILHSKI